MSEVKIYRVYSFRDENVKKGLPNILNIPAKAISEVYEPIGYYDAKAFYDLISEYGDSFYVDIEGIEEIARLSGDNFLMTLVREHFKIEEELKNRGIEIWYQVIYLE